MSIRVAIDASSAQLGGGLTYLRELLPRLAARDDINVTALLVRRRVADEPWVKHADHVLVGRSRFSALGRSWLNAVRHQADVLYAPTEIAVAHPRVPLVLALRSPLYDPAVRVEYSRSQNARAVIMRWFAKGCARGARKHIAVSNYISAVGTRYLRIPPDRICLVYHGGPTHRKNKYRPPSSPTLFEPTRLLFVSNISSRYKNLHRLLEALRWVKGDWTLEIAGSITDGAYRSEIMVLAEAVELRDRISFLGHCNRNVLKQLYARSDWLVWPSYGETFGHPLVEANYEGVGLLAARSRVNQEIAGDAARYFDPFDIADMRKALQDVIGWRRDPPPPLPRRYTWDKCADETAHVLSAAAKVH